MIGIFDVSPTHPQSNFTLSDSRRRSGTVGEGADPDGGDAVLPPPPGEGGAAGADGDWKWE